MRALWPEEAKGMWDSLVNSGFHFPSKSVLYACRPRMDATAMLMERRMFNGGPWARRGRQRSIHIYTDSSPITGLELLGSIFDMFMSGVELIGHLLPGTVLGHGFVDTECKIMALLHCIFLDRRSIGYLYFVFCNDSG